MLKLFAVVMIDAEEERPGGVEFYWAENPEHALAQAGDASCGDIEYPTLAVEVPDIYTNFGAIAERKQADEVRLDGEWWALLHAASEQHVDSPAFEALARKIASLDTRVVDYKGRVLEGE